MEKKKLKELIVKIEELGKTESVRVVEEEIIITSTEEDIDRLDCWQEQIKEITGKYPSPCDVNVRDWIVQLN